MKFGHAVWAASLCLWTAAPVHASSGFACSIADKTLALTVEGVFSRGAGEGVMNFGGRLEVLAKAAPEDFRSLDLERENLTQAWIYGRDMKLRIYRERTGNTPHGYVELVLETRQSKRDEPEYAGTFLLTVFHMASEQSGEGKTFTSRGKVTCSGE